MARVNVYLPDDLAARAKTAGLNLSAVTQSAVRRSLSARSTDLWLASLHRSSAELSSGPRASHDDVIEALDAVRDEAPTRHG